MTKKKLSIFFVVGLLFGIALVTYASEVTGNLTTGTSSEVTGNLNTSLTTSSEVTGNITTSLGNNILGVVVGPPRSSVPSGVYTSSQTIVFTAAGAQSISYTTNGSTPTCSSGTIYVRPFTVSTSQTIKAVSCYQNNTIVSSVATYNYVIAVGLNQLISFLNDGTFIISSGGTSTSTFSITVTRQVAIQVSGNGGITTIVLPAGLVITSSDNGRFNATLLTSSILSTSEISGFNAGTLVRGVLQWGIPNVGLVFSQPIIVNFFLGTERNGDTLTLFRSIDGATGWTSEGIVSPASCNVASGVCTFSATRASYYATTFTPSSGGGSGGGGGGSAGGGSGGSGGSGGGGTVITSSPSDLGVGGVGSFADLDSPTYSSRNGGEPRTGNTGAYSGEEVTSLDDESVAIAAEDVPFYAPLISDYQGEPQTRPLLASILTLGTGNNVVAIIILLLITLGVFYAIRATANRGRK